MVIVQGGRAAPAVETVRKGSDVIEGSGLVIVTRCGDGDSNGVG